MVTILPSRTIGDYEKGTGDQGTLFSCSVKWLVAGAKSGFIVQRIQRNEKYRVEEKTFQVAQFKDVVSTHDYWEAWEIDRYGNAQPMDDKGVNDNFGVYENNTVTYRGNDKKTFPSKKGTRGHWKIRGTVYYVPFAQFEGTQWYRAFDLKTKLATNEIRAVRSAGRLLSRYDPPVGGDGLVVGAFLGRVMVKREFAGTWDWTKKPPDSDERDWPWGGNFDTVNKGAI